MTDADARSPLGLDELELLARAAHLAGDDDASASARTRAHQAALGLEQPARAARHAFWHGFGLAERGDMAQAGGWFARAATLLDQHGTDCAEQGYLRIPEGLGALSADHHDEARRCFGAVLDAGERHGDADLVVLGRLGIGQACVLAAEVATGVRLLDEAMVAISAGEVSPEVAGIVYCGVIAACLTVFDLGRAREWTDALQRWCDGQPQLVPYALADAGSDPTRALVLPAAVDVLLAADHLDEARQRAGELSALAAELDAPVLHARSRYATGAVTLAGGDAAGALAPLTAARDHWLALDAPYEAARTGMLLADAHRATGDGDTADLEAAAARESLDRLGVGTDPAPDTADHPLTRRELEVLRLVATGATSREIAGELVVSERTIDRHLSNIFTRLGVTSRTAAAAWAFEHGVAEPGSG